MTPEFYTMLFTMHGTVMVFLVIIPVLAGAFGNFLIPLQIGAEDMAFPKLNMLSYWVYFALAIVCFGYSLLTPPGSLGAGPASGWTAYPAAGRVATDANPGTGPAQTWWPVRADADRREFSMLGVRQLSDDDHQHAGPRHDAVPHAE